MEDLDHLSTGSSHFRGHFNISQEFVRHSLEGIWWPFREPVDGCAIDDRGEISDSIPNGITDWRKAEDYVQELFASLKEEPEKLLRSAFGASLFFLGWSSNKFAHVSLFICSKNVRDLSSI